MKRFFTLLVLLISYFSAYAQHMSVESFSILENDLDARTHFRKLDQNGRVAALIKIESTVKGFSFDVGSLGIVDTDHSKTAETWVYVPMGVIRMTIQHGSLGTIRNYEFPIPISEATVYRMVLTTANINTIIEEDVGGQFFVLNVNPKVATLTIDNGLPIEIETGSTNQFLSYGAHNYTVSADRYLPESGVITVGDKRINKTVNLIPNFGQININSTPSNAKVEINGINIGTTPIKAYELTLGNYAITLSAAGYESTILDVTLTPEKGVANINTTLKSYKSKIDLVAATATDSIYVNDIFMGAGRYSELMMPGTYIVRSSKSGHRDQIERLSVERNTPKEFKFKALTPQYGKVVVAANVNDAKIFIDDKDSGLTTPNICNNVLATSHKVSIVKEGYTTQSQVVHVQEGKVHNLNFNLVQSVPLAPQITATPAPTPSGGGLTLAQFSEQSYPTDTDTWVITNYSADISEFVGLRTALKRANSNNRKITLQFPNLTSIPSSAESSDGAFYQCWALVGASLPNATSIGDNAFYNTNLKYIDLPKVVTVGLNSLRHCTSLTKISLPEATTIGETAFCACYALKEVYLPKATKLDYGVFFSCGVLPSVDLPQATTIGTSLFYECSEIKSINLPKISGVGYGAFKNCTNLTSLKIATADGVTIRSFADNALEDVNTNNVTLTVGSSNKSFVSRNQLSVGDFRGSFKSIIVQNGSSSSSSSPSQSYSGGGDFSALAHYSASNYPTNTNTWVINNYSASLSEFTGLREALIAAKSSGRKITLRLPNITSIPSAGDKLEGAFNNCSALISIDLPKATTIGDFAFYYCTSITSINVPQAHTIGFGAFYNNNDLTSVRLPSAIKIGEDGFSSCDDLVEIIAPKVTTIDSYAFAFNRAMTRIQLPLITELSAGLFRSCEKLTSVEAPAASKIKYGVFSGCTSLTSIKIATNSGVALSEIGNTAFENVNTNNVTLTIGSRNRSNISGSTLNIGNKSVSFRRITTL